MLALEPVPQLLGLAHEALLLGVPHGFSLRTGGVSEGAFGSLNLARTVGDAPEAVAENHRRFAAAVGVDAARLFEVSQVHGRRVVTAEPGADPAELRLEEADALVTRGPGAVAVRTADCVPLLFADLTAGVVAAAHAGWRGVEARIAQATLEQMGSAPADVIAVIGPHIRRFEVGPEVAERIAAVAEGERVVRPGEPRPFVDLAATLRAQLEALGVGAIEDVGGCTLDEPARFFSHRRDAGHTGRHLAAIALPPRAT